MKELSPWTVSVLECFCQVSSAQTASFLTSRLAFNSSSFLPHGSSVSQRCQGKEGSEEVGSDHPPPLGARLTPRCPPYRPPSLLFYSPSLESVSWCPTTGPHAPVLTSLHSRLSRWRLAISSSHQVSLPTLPDSSGDLSGFGKCRKTVKFCVSFKN